MDGGLVGRGSVREGGWMVVWWGGGQLGRGDGWWFGGEGGSGEGGSLGGGMGGGLVGGDRWGVIPNKVMRGCWGLLFYLTGCELAQHFISCCIFLAF